MNASMNTWQQFEKTYDPLAERAAERKQAAINRNILKKAQTNRSSAVAAPKQEPSKVRVVGDRLKATKDVPQSPRGLVPPSFNFYLYPASQKAQVLIDRVIERWLKSGHIFKRPIKDDVLQNYKKIVETVTLNVLWALLRNVDAVRIRRERALLSRKSRYRPDLFDTKILTVLDDLHAMRVLHQDKGDRWVNGHFEQAGKVDQEREYKQTRLFVGQVVKELRQLLNVESVLEIGEALEQQEIIVLKKGESSALAEYADNADTDKLREQMRRINLSLAEAGSLLAREIPPSMKATIDERDRHLVRRFTYGEDHPDFTSGGRLWGGFWENMKREQRPGWLRIKGEQTVECDYSGIMPRLAYLVVGEGKVEVPAGDVYNIPGLSTESRAGIKIVITAALMETRTTPKDRFPKGAAELFTPEDRVKGYKKIVELILAHHPTLKPVLWTGIGHYLQSLESTLLVNVLLDLGQKHIVGLPLHDGIICQESKAEVVQAVMEHRALAVLGWEIPVRVKRGSKGDSLGSGGSGETKRHQKEG